MIENDEYRVDVQTINASPRKLTATFSLDTPLTGLEKEICIKLAKELIKELHPNMFQRIFNYIRKVFVK